MGSVMQAIGWALTYLVCGFIGFNLIDFVCMLWRLSHPTPDPPLRASVDGFVRFEMFGHVMVAGDELVLQFHDGLKWPLEADEMCVPDGFSYFAYEASGRCEIALGRKICMIFRSRDRMFKKAYAQDRV